MPRSLVTGGFGFVGSHVVQRLLDRGDEVVVYDPADPPPDLAGAAGDVRHVRGDVRDATALTAAATGVDEIYHLAAVVGVDRYLSRPLDVVEVNVDGTRNALRAGLRCGARVLVSSTSEVYGRNPRVPWREEDDRVLGSTATDRWSYATSKAAAEHLTFAYHRQEGLPVVVLRYFNVYGPRQRPAYVLSRTIARLLRGDPPVVYDDGRQTRCFTWVPEAAEATLLAAAHPRAVGECFNIGNTVETPVAEAIRLAAEVAGVTVSARTADTGAGLGARYQDIPRRVPDCGKAASLLGWRAETPLATGLRHTVEWARRNPWWTAQADDGLVAR
ncbi:NAD-dependent epimerase/dehydratase family protein [Verrucosispora sp. WMMD1129]|uniref:NAD-dependent epimerase/dehydratase family protein n=1 Tax=Verrucosispora sp. WMMD1129 TaxID=3016093 RepID=UPI00249BA2C6|nr:NAD-dependent epimerase/dehydratase family protein [Verrucosispora sp. WMMD1129]WFE43613.1 NAD-dependent epimerase/dehydratase family protein [Verrucosispora sp. WMMD1129]